MIKSQQSSGFAVGFQLAGSICDNWKLNINCPLVDNSDVLTHVVVHPSHWRQFRFVISIADAFLLSRSTKLNWIWFWQFLFPMQIVFFFFLFWFLSSWFVLRGVQIVFFFLEVKHSFLNPYVKSLKAYIHYLFVRFAAKRVLCGIMMVVVSAATLSKMRGKIWLVLIWLLNRFTDYC